MKKCSVLTAPIVALLILGGSTAAAFVYERASADSLLLTVDAIVFADAVALHDGIGDEQDVCWVEFQNANVLASRMPEVGPTFTLPVRLSDTDAVARSLLGADHMPRVDIPTLGLHIEFGQRYLVLIEGGHEGPFATGMRPLYRVEADTGYVECAGGYLYGLGPHGFICGSPDLFVGPPLKESGLVAGLLARLQVARKTRPQEAKYHDAHVGPITAPKR